MTNINYLRYVVENTESCEVRTWEGEAKKAHRTFRQIAKADLTSFPESQVKYTITGESNELVKEYEKKAKGYLNKITVAKPEVKPEPKKKQIKVTNKTIAEAYKNGELTELESVTLDWLLTDGYYAEYMFSDLEVSDIAKAVGIKVSSMKGVVGSLVKKGYLWVSEADDDVPPLVYATPKGYKLDDNWKERWEEAETDDSLYC